MQGLKISWQIKSRAISRVNVGLETNVSETSSIIRVDVFTSTLTRLVAKKDFRA
jgi:hypothetical protein